MKFDSNVRKNNCKRDEKDWDNDRNKFEKTGGVEEKKAGGNDKFQIFEQWLKENGILTPKLELRDYGNEVRGCHSTENIREDEIVIQVPLKCLITVEMGKQTEIGRAILNSEIDLDAPKHIFLMVFMLVDMKNPKSFFKPYYDILPQTLHNMPIFWSKEELEDLKGSYLLEQINERNKAIENDYAAICSIHRSFSQYATLQEFKWARMCVCSRNFGLVINGMQTAALVPYADMLNHYRPRETKWQFDDSLQGFTVVSLQQLSRGCQVYDSYGRKCNHRFLLNYGFSIENNVEGDGYCPNEVPFLLELDVSDPLYNAKCEFWRRDFSVRSKRIRCSASDNENFKMMMAFLRIAKADEEDFKFLVSCSKSNLYRSIRDAQVAVTVKNELRVLSTLNSMCDEYLSKYTNSYEHDCKKLDSGTLQPFSNEKHALIQIKGEKEVLLFFKDLSLTGRQLLNVSDMNEFDRLLAQVKRNKNPAIYHYCYGTINRLQQDAIRCAEIRARDVDFSKATVI